jgi:CHAD domain-containing protein
MDDCSRHSKQVAGIADMKFLAEAIGDLHYEQLSLLLYHLSDKFFHDGKKDEREGRTQLSSSLFKAQLSTHRAHQHIDEAWKISKPFITQ